ncbi:MAG: hypothetical protein AABW93_03815, partial [Nanoarchaeota archaeon]
KLREFLSQALVLVKFVQLHRAETIDLDGVPSSISTFQLAASLKVTVNHLLFLIGIASAYEPDISLFLSYSVNSNVLKPL